MASGKIIFTFGRIQPPHIGHLRVFRKVLLLAQSGKGDAKIFTSRSHDNQDNPLPTDEKIRFIKKIFPGFSRYIVNNRELMSIFDVLHFLEDEGYTEAVLVVGADRVKQFQDMVKPYVNTDSPDALKFDSFKVVSAGARDPDSGGVEGVSATELRQAAKDNDFKAFQESYPPSVSRAVLKNMFHMIQKNLSINSNDKKSQKEDIQMVKSTFKNWLTEKYNSGAEHNWDLYREYKTKMDEEADSGYLVIDKDGKGHLPVMKNGKLDHRLMGAAHAALLSPKGFRGKKYQGPDKTKAISKLKSLYKKEKMEWPK